MDNPQIQIVLQLAAALLFGGAIGLEREHKGKEAGLQTYTLVALGSCLFTILSFEVFKFFVGQPGIGFDPSRIILAVATGIGFIGGGVIVHREFRTEGLTTAAGLWTAAAIGVAVGLRLFFLAFLGTIFTIFVLVVYGEIERRLLGKK